MVWLSLAAFKAEMLWADSGCSSFEVDWKEWTLDMLGKNRRLLPIYPIPASLGKNCFVGSLGIEGLGERDDCEGACIKGAVEDDGTYAWNYNAASLGTLFCEVTHKLKGMLSESSFVCKPRKSLAAVSLLSGPEIEIVLLVAVLIFWAKMEKLI